MRNLDVRYHSDGSIDFDYYRRRAARQRGIVRRAFIRRGFRLIAMVPAMFRALVDRGSRVWLRRTVRASAARSS